MNKIDKVIDAFVTGDYFIIFLVIMLVILLVLVLALIKSREEYDDLVNNSIDNNDDVLSDNKETDLMDDLKSLMAASSDDVIDEDKPLIKQLNYAEIKANREEEDRLLEENAIISADELEQKAKERLEALGSTENQEAIAKYEEEQEKRAIISYDQLVKNAANISLSYEEEDLKEKNAPKVSKVLIEQKEVSEAENYLEEEEFLRILKEFRVKLE